MFGVTLEHIWIRCKFNLDILSYLGLNWDTLFAKPFQLGLIRAILVRKTHPVFYFKVSFYDSRGEGKGAVPVWPCPSSFLDAADRQFGTCECISFPPPVSDVTGSPASSVCPKNKTTKHGQKNKTQKY